MATFPALEPVSRRRTLGAYPVSTEVGDVRFLHGPIPSGQALELSYQYLTQTEAELIREHYRTQEGGFLSFVLPDIVNLGNSFPLSGSAFPVAWKYAALPEETHHENSRVSITVQLIAVI
jgi:hypothetical protein